VPPEPPSPPLRDLFGRSDARRAFLQFHLEDRLLGSLEHLGFLALKHAPPAFASNFGAAISPGPRFLNRNAPWLAGMRRSAVHIRPELADDPAGVDALMASWFVQSCRTHAEYPILHKLTEPDHVTVTWDPQAHDLAASGRQMVIVQCHLGAWECSFDPMAHRFGRKGDIFAIYEPQPNRFRNRIAARVRDGRGLPCLPPGPVTQRLLPKLLKDGKQTIFFHIDENVGDTVGFPLFGRAPVPRSNLMRAIKTARIFDAPILSLTTWRTGPAQVRVHLHAPIAPKDIGRHAAGAQEAIARLNAIYEPVIRAHLEQWFMLPWMNL
jgi:lauroyl/myristoyl acyltransferase